MNKIKIASLAFFTLILGTFLIVRINSPLENRPNTDRLMHDETNHHDDLVSFITAKNFNNDGWIKSYGIPNRKGVVTQGYWKIPCSNPQKEANSPKNNVTSNYSFTSADGTLIELTSNQKDCYYTHFPPLADWLWGSAYSLGAKDFLSFKLIAILVKMATLFIFLLAFSRHFSLFSTLIAGTLFSTFFYQISWASSLYVQPWSYFFFAILFFEVLNNKKNGWRISIWTFFLYLTTPEFILFPFALLVLCSKDRWKKTLANVLIGALLAICLSYLQRTFFFGSFTAPFKDLFIDGYSRYPWSEFSLRPFDYYFQAFIAPHGLILLTIFTAFSIALYEKGLALKLFTSFLLIAFSLWIFQPSYASKHTNHWIGHFQLLLLICYLLISEFAYKHLRNYKKYSSLKTALTTFFFLGLIGLILSLQFQENYLRIKLDYPLTKMAQESYDPHDLSKKALTILVEQTPAPSDTYFNHNVRYALIDNLTNRYSFIEAARPVYLPLQNTTQLIINLHYLEPLSFNELIFDISPSLDRAVMSCSVKNLETNILVSAQTQIKQNALSFKFKEIKGRDFQISCSELPATSLTEMRIYLHHET